MTDIAMMIYTLFLMKSPLTRYTGKSLMSVTTTPTGDIFEQEKKQWVEQNGRIEYEKAGTSVADCMKLNKLLRLKYRKRF